MSAMPRHYPSLNESAASLNVKEVLRVRIVTYITIINLKAPKPDILQMHKLF